MAFRNSPTCTRISGVPAPVGRSHGVGTITLPEFQVTTTLFRTVWARIPTFRRWYPWFSHSLAAVLVAGNVYPVHAQPVEERAEPDALVAAALEVHPMIRAARARVDAARAAIGPAGTLPDPMLTLGITNFPVSEPGFEDLMTMKMVGVGQMVPYPGKLALRRRVTERELAAAEARLEAARLTVVEQVRAAYYELAFLHRVNEIIARNQSLLTNFVRVTESRYGVGTGGQPDVLKARVELARLAEEAVAITEHERATLARLNAALSRPSETPVEAPHVPGRIARAAVADDARRIRFSSTALGARAADSPLPPLTEVQERAVLRNPEILAHEAMIERAAVQVALARKEHLPDFDVSLQYSQRTGRTDMVSAMVAIPLPLRRDQRQDLLVREAEARLAALEAERQQRVDELRAEVAVVHGDLERERAQLALFVTSILPLGRAALESATAGFQVGRVDFLTLLEHQATLYDYETQYHRAISDFATGLAALESAVGGEILR